MSETSERFSQMQITTPLGLMLAISDDKSLYLLEFVDCCNLDNKMDRFKEKVASEIRMGYTQPIKSIENELKQYFDGKLKTFKTPLAIPGTTFQKQVWENLKKIPFGETRSYSDLAYAIGNPTACRAIGTANGCNQFAIVIPCHRVINKNNHLGGYAGGIEKKKWLLNHERKFCCKQNH